MLGLSSGNTYDYVYKYIKCQRGSSWYPEFAPRRNHFLDPEFSKEARMISSAAHLKSMKIEKDGLKHTTSRQKLVGFFHVHRF